MLETSPFYLNDHLGGSDRPAVFDSAVFTNTNKTVLQ